MLLNKNFTLVALFLVAFQSFGWGQIGHRVVGGIAQNHLDKNTTIRIGKIMNGKSLADSGTWADEKRSNPHYNELKKSHYTSINDGSKYKQERSDDIIAMISKLIDSLKKEKKLKGYKDKILNSLSEKDRLSLLVHFIGDLHQPLHVGRASDWGGNRVRVLWFEKESNLHKVWDESIIDQMKLSFSEIIQFIDYPESIKNSWYKSLSNKKMIMDALNESLSYRSLVYDFRNKYIEKPVMMSEKEILKKYRDAFGKKGRGKNLPYLKWNYNYRAAPVVKKRLLQAGIRLAEILNNIYQ